MQSRYPIDRRSRHYSTQSLLVAVALGAAVGLVLAPVNYALLGIGTAFPPAQSASMGLLAMASLLPLATVRRGGSGIIGGTAAGAISLLMPGGVFMVVAMGVWGAIMEFPFFITGYRRFGWPMFVLAGLIAGEISCVISVFTWNLGSMSLTLAALICVAQLVSFIAGSMVSWALARALARSGIGGGERVIAS